MDSTTLLETAARAVISPLATIDGASYYELGIVVRRTPDQPTAIVGLAADWPILERNIRIAELERLVEALQRQAVDSEHHCQDLIARNEDLARQLEVAQQIPPAVALAASGMPAENPPPGLRRKCPYCNARPKLALLQAHLNQEHPNRPADAAATPPALAEAPWQCAACKRNTFARSVADPSRCIQCVAHDAPTNGQVLAAA